MSEILRAIANGLQQVILNLALNAFRHTPMGGSLTISAQAAGPGRGCGLLRTSGEGIAGARPCRRSLMPASVEAIDGLDLG